MEDSEKRKDPDEHEAFAASRVSQFVYVPTKDSFFTALDQHADTLEGDIKPPLVLVGNEGSGKSALLANWISKRSEHKQKEFLFQHYVGCSTPSLQLAHTLFRLETALKDVFNLREMTVPDNEEDLRWSFNRFLAAAAKKRSPARILIIIDGVHRLKHQSGPDGALHWLPTELPPCVRFILSTVEFDRNRFNATETPLHRTYVELVRRQCPLLHIEPLGIPTRHSIIDAFYQFNNGLIEFTENQQFKIVTSAATSQPMYLRSLLQSLRLTLLLTKLSVDSILDTFIVYDTAHEIIDRCLNICSNAISHTDEHHHTRRQDILGKIFAMIYVSRNGLSIDEIWGIFSITSTGKNLPDYKNPMNPSDELFIKNLYIILNDFTMIVNNMHSFTHEVYREVVYSKYIGTKESLIRWHNLLAKYFDQLPPCDRKLVALPYHLEQCSAWTKVKNCLTDIEMFHLWWTPKFRSDFIKFWASLTKQPSSYFTDKHFMTTTKKEKKNNKQSNSNYNNISSPVSPPSTTENKQFNNNDDTQYTDDLDDVNNSNILQKKKPVYDIVDEYVKSLEEYRTIKQPTDEELATIVLEIADFLLEYATLGHEANADVPNFVHPAIPARDLKSLGVPYITTDEEGRSSLVYPALFDDFLSKNGTDNDAVLTKAVEDIPICSTYFFQRWLWIQFPYIALGNCNERYIKGKSMKVQDSLEIGKIKNSNDLFNTMNRPTSSGTSIGLRRLNTRATMNTISSSNLNSIPKPSNTLANSASNLHISINTNNNEIMMSKTWSSNNDVLKLPSIPKFHKKASRSVRKIVNNDSKDSLPMSEITQKLIFLQDDIQGYRDECDYLGQLKHILNNKLDQLKGNLIDLQNTEVATHNYDKELEDIKKLEAISAKKATSCEILYHNLLNVITMCNRHPASFQSSIDELQNKINLDNYLLNEIKKRLWETKFEKQQHNIYYNKMKSLVKNGVDIHKELLHIRYDTRKNLTVNEKKLINDNNTISHIDTFDYSSNRKKSLVTGILKNKKDNQANSNIVNSTSQTAKVHKSWEEIWPIICKRTGITDPEVFFQRINNGKILEDQMSTLKKQSESRLDFLKKELVTVEAELEESRYDASVGNGMQSIKEQQKDLAEKQFLLRHQRERAVAAEQLQQKVLGGLVHLGETLCITTREEDSSVTDLQRDIEAVIDRILDEREKQLQQIQGQLHSQPSVDSYSRSISNTQTNPETHHRAPELDFIIAKYEAPKLRLASNLTKTKKEGIISEPEEEDEGLWDRKYVKNLSIRYVKKVINEIKRSTQVKSDNNNSTKVVRKQTPISETPKTS